MGIGVDGVPLDFAEYPYIPEIIDGFAPETTIVKGAQMGFTVAAILKDIEAMRTERLRGSLYLLPTDDEVQALAKSRVDPIMAQECYQSLGSSVDTSSLKAIGSGFWFFRGAGQRGGIKHKSLSKLKSFPSDRVTADEYDEMDPKRLDAARHRLDGSSRPGWTGLSTPTLPEYGVDLDYKRSDQSMWWLICQKCNAETCLELEWPDCIAEPSGRDPYYLCRKCRDEIDRHFGHWVAKHPDRTRDHRGFYVSQLGSLVRTAGQVLADLDRAEASGRQREFFNQVLARPYADVEDVLTDALMNACIDSDRPRARSAAGPCAMGVDPGVRSMHYVVGGRLNDRDSQIYDWGQVGGFDDIAHIAKRFNVDVGVMDQGAETRMVRAFVAEHPEWWGCQYVTKRKSGYDWNRSDRVVTAGRTEALDASHHAIVDRHESFPAKDETYTDTVLPQMKNLARTKLENDQGVVEYRWVVTGGVKNDHIKHAHAYYRMALEKAPLIQQITRSVASRQMRRKRSAMTL
jgi:hypothetical protein